MADIENLNFEVILQDKNFRKRVEEDIKIAQDLNVRLSDALNFNKKVSIDPLKRVTTEVKNMTKEMDKFNKSASKDVKKSVTQIGRMNSTLTTSSNLMRTLGQLTGVTFSVIGLRRFLSTLIDVTGQFEVQKMALRNMLQDIDAADKIFQDLYNFSSESTYRFSELAKYAKQLAAFNIDKNNLLETTKMLGDVASGVGVSMDRLILAYGHVKSSGFLRGIQLRSFSQNGVPILEELSKMFTEIEGKAVSLGDVFDKMMKREIGFDMVEEAFRRMTSEGGKFYQMQEVLAKTLAGQINILKGKWENLMYAMGQSQEGVLKGVVSSLTNIVSNTENFGRALKEAIAILGSYKVAAFLATAATMGWEVALAKTLAVMQKLIVFVINNPIALLAATIATATVTIINYAHEINETAKYVKALNDAHEDWQKQLGAEISELEALYARLQSAKKGTEEYDAAKRALEGRFDPYIQQLREEGVEVGNLADLYKNLKERIESASYARFAETANKNLDEIHAETIGQVLNGGGRNPYTAARLAKALKLDDRSTAALHQVALGQKTYEEVLQSGLAPGFIKAMEEGQIEAGRGVWMSAKQYLGYVIDRVKESTEEWEKGRNAVEEYGKTIMQFSGSGSNDPANSMSYKIQTIVDGIKNLDAEIEKIRTKAKSEGINEEEKSQLDALVEDREDQAKLYKSIMGKDYDKSIKAAQTEQNKATKDRISNLKAEAAVLEKYLDAREKLEPFFGGETGKQLAKIFGDSRDYSALEADIATLCDRLRELGTEGVEAAEQIETRLGLDKTSSILKAQKALQKWQGTLRKWTKDWGGGDYHGIEGDIDKVIRDYNNEDDEITQDYIDSLNEIMEAHWGDADAINAEIAALDKLVSARRAANATQQQEKLNDLASKYVKDKTHNLNLRDWGDKSIGQVRSIYNALTELAKGEVTLDETMTNRLKRSGLAIEDFSKLAKEEFEQLSENAKQELEKKLANTLKEIVSDLNAVAQAVRDFGTATGNLHLASLAEDFMQITSMVGTVAERVLSGDIPGAISAGLSAIVTGFFQAKAAAAQFQASLRAAREEARRLGFSDTLGNGVDSIFGTNEMAKVRNAVTSMQRARAAMASNTQPGSFKSTKGFWDYFWNGGTRVNQYSLSEMAESVGRDLYDAYGNLNADTLQVILDTYEGLGVAEREWITRAIHDSEAYTEAMEQLEGVVSSVFRQMASSASDAIVEQWKERGDAALDYADILDDVATRYAKMMIESAILDKVLTPEKASAIVDMFARGDAEGAMASIAEDMAAIKENAPLFEQILTALDPYFNRTSGSSSDSLREGINKELVEGNSSLIASYMNAMRADLSVLRQLQTAGWADVRLVRETMPTLADHVARIEANTYDNAVAAQGILSKLSSIITPSTNGGSAVRTTK